MSEHDPDEINRLIGEFMDLQEQWESDPDRFDWPRLQALAGKGARAYNEGFGPSFHALALDGVAHREFHERFLAYSLKAGFDPFRLARTSSATNEVPVIDHESLAEAALSNPASARIRATLLELARIRFAPLADEIRKGKSDPAHWLYRMIDACAESIPLDLLEETVPELARSHHGEARVQMVDPIEGYLSAAEVMAEGGSKPYG